MLEKSLLMCYNGAMKKILITLVASLALLLPAAAQAAQGGIALTVPNQGQLEYFVPGAKQFTFNTTVPFSPGLVENYGNDLRNRQSDWQNFSVQLTECSRIMFALPEPLGDTGWHCQIVNNGPPSEPTFIPGLPMNADDQDDYLGIGRECAIPRDPIPPGEAPCLTPGINEHPFHFPEIDVSNFIGTGLPGTLYENVHADLMYSTENGTVNALALGDTGTITQIGGGFHFSALQSLTAPVNFTLKPFKHTSFKSWQAKTRASVLKRFKHRKR